MDSSAQSIQRNEAPRVDIRGTLEYRGSGIPPEQKCLPRWQVGSSVASQPWSSAEGDKAKKHPSQTLGVTLVELIVVVAIISVMSTVTYGLMTGLEFRTDTQTSLDKITAQIKSQKLKAMLGAGSGGGTAIYFHLGTNKYTAYSCPEPPSSCLFSGSNETNAQESSEDSVSFLETTFSNNTVFFESKSGEIKNFIDGIDNTIVVVNAADGSKYALKFSKTGSVLVTKI